MRWSFPGPRRQYGHVHRSWVEERVGAGTGVATVTAAELRVVIGARAGAGAGARTVVELRVATRAGVGVGAATGVSTVNFTRFTRNFQR